MGIPGCLKEAAGEVEDDYVGLAKQGCSSVMELLFDSSSEGYKGWVGAVKTEVFLVIQLTTESTLGESRSLVLCGRHFSKVASVSYFVVLDLASSCGFPVSMSRNGVDVVGESKGSVTPIVRGVVRCIVVSRGEHSNVLVVVLMILVVSEYWERRVRYVTHVPNIDREDGIEDGVTSNSVSDNR